MKVAIFNTKSYDKKFLEKKNSQFEHELVFFESPLNEETLPLARGYPAICIFVNDRLSAAMIVELRKHGTKLIALRCAGFNQVNLEATRKEGVTVVRVPAYSPYAVAEHTAGLVLTLNRKIHRSFHRVREGNFSLEGLLGFDLHGRSVGIIGTGKIGESFARIMNGFGCRLFAFDPTPNLECEKLGVQYFPLDELFKESDIISLHCPLFPKTQHIINSDAIQKMKKGVMLINTSRGGLVDTKDVIEGLKEGKVGSLGLDVYEEEEDLFFQDLSDQVIQDDTFSRLLTLPNVVVTGH